MLRALRSILLPFLLALCALFLAPLAWGQGHTSGTDYGKSQNTTQDLANSLTPGKERVGKGEKKSEVDPKSLPSKKAAKDPLFQGGLADIGVDWNGDKIGKQRGSQGANSDSKASKPADAAAEKDSKASSQTGAAGESEKASKSKDAAGGDQHKEQKAEPSKSDDKPADKEKAANKIDGDH